MYETDMLVETDGNEMTSIVGTTDGRVFMTGIADGCLYELFYQAEEGWFTKRVRLENRSVGPLNRLIPGVLGTRYSGASNSFLRCSFSLHSSNLFAPRSDCIPRVRPRPVLFTRLRS